MARLWNFTERLSIEWRFFGVEWLLDALNGFVGSVFLSGWRRVTFFTRKADS
jgi:hypothetical protein